MMRTGRFVGFFLVAVAATCVLRPGVVYASEQFYIHNLSFLGMPAMPGPPYGIYPTVLKAGMPFTFRTNVHSIFALAPEVTADLSQLGLSSLATTSAGSGGVPGHYSANFKDYFPNYYYNFGPFVLGADVQDGLKTVSVAAADIFGNASNSSTQILVDNAPPTIILSDISFSTTSPRMGDYMYISGSIDGTGSTVFVSGITQSILDEHQQRIGVWPYHTAGYGPDALFGAAGATSTSFSNVPIQLTEATAGEIAEAAFLKLEVSVYDQAGNFASTSLAVPVPKTPKVSNVLFLPGIEGSRLYRPVDGCDIAIVDCEEHKLWDPSGDADLIDLALDASGRSVRSDVYVKEGDLVISAAAYGLEKDFYTSFVAQMDTLKAGGTIADWEPIAYDWRLSLPDLVEKGVKRYGKIFYEEATTTPYIEQTLRSLAASSKTGKVTIIAHSNGGLVTKALIEKLGPATAESLIDDIIFVGVPQSGAPQAVGGLLFGHKQALPFDNCSQLFLVGSICSSLASRAAARSLAEHSPMAYHLLPSDAYFSSVQDPNHSVVSFSGTKEYQEEQEAYGTTIDNFAELSSFLQAEEGGRTAPEPGDTSLPGILQGNLLDYAKGEHSTLDIWIPPSGITLHQIAGWGVDTISGISFYEGSKYLGLVPGKVPKYRPIFVEDGDGIVPVPSALLMSTNTENVKRYWADLYEYEKSSGIIVKHANMLEMSGIKDLVLGILFNDLSLPFFISTQQIPSLIENKKLIFYLHSPLTLQLVDSSGNTAGLSSDGFITENISGASYGRFGEVQYIVAPAGNYSLSLDGQSSGTFALEIQEVTDGEVTSSVAIEDVPTTENTMVSLSISGGIQDISDLLVDGDGDGTSETSITLEENETIVYTPPAIEVEIPVEARGGGGGSISSELESPVTLTEEVVPTATIPIPEINIPVSTFEPQPILPIRREAEAQETISNTEISKESNLSADKEVFQAQTAAAFEAVSQQSWLHDLENVAYTFLSAGGTLLKSLFQGLFKFLF